MIGTSLQSSELESFKMANSLIRDPIKSNSDNSFGEVLNEQTKETTRKIKDKAAETASDDKATKKKKTKENLEKEDVLSFAPLGKNPDQAISNETKNTYLLLEKFKQRKRNSNEEDLLNTSRKPLSPNVYNAPGQPLFQPLFDEGQRRMNKSQILANWEKFAPVVTEDITKKAIRIDIPLINDVQALVLRMNPDRSITASLLGSQVMGELIKQNKEKLDRNLKHHHLSLREFNTYRSELEFTGESGTRKKKKQNTGAKKAELDLV